MSHQSSLNIFHLSTLLKRLRLWLEIRTHRWHKPNVYTSKAYLSKSLLLELGITCPMCRRDLTTVSQYTQRLAREHKSIQNSSKPSPTLKVTVTKAPRTQTTFGDVEQQVVVGSDGLHFPLLRKTSANTCKRNTSTKDLPRSTKSVGSTALVRPGQGRLEK